MNLETKGYWLDATTRNVTQYNLLVFECIFVVLYPVHAKYGLPDNVAAFVLEWAMLLRGYTFDWDPLTKSFQLDVQSLLHADFVCASVLISFGAVLGKTNPSQLIEVFIQVSNEYVGVTYFCNYDAGD